MFLFSFTDSVLLSTNYSTKTFKMGVFITSIDSLGTRKKKIIDLYVLGSPLAFFQKAVLYICIVPFYSLVPI